MTIETTCRMFAVALLVFAFPANAQTWTSDPVVAGEGCDDLEYVDIAVFLESYLTTSDSYEGSKKESSAAMLLHYTIASALVNRSQVCLAEALELKALTDQLKEQQALLTSGTSMSKQQVKKQRALTAEANAEIEAAAARVEELTPEQKERFGKGTSAYFAGTYATGEVFRSIEGFIAETGRAAEQQVNNGKPRSGALGGLGAMADAAKGAANVFGIAKGAGFVFKGLKDHTTELVATSQYLKSYSEQKDIELPDDATNQLTGFNDWV